MGSSEIRVHVGTVRRHASEIRSANSSLAAKETSKVEAGSTNFEGYIRGVPCSKSITRILSNLTNKIEKDCSNLNSAAEAVNKMDKQIASTFNGNAGCAR